MSDWACTTNDNFVGLALTPHNRNGTPDGVNGVTMDGAGRWFAKGQCSVPPNNANIGSARLLLPTGYLYAIRPDWTTPGASSFATTRYFAWVRGVYYGGSYAAGVLPY